MKENETGRLIEALQAARRVVVFTGAGISTDSGIPDYRGSGGQYSAYQPVYYQEFLSDDRKRRSYWQHKASVWPAIRAARPTAGHRLAFRLLETGRLSGVVTQNIDGLHEKSGLPPGVVVNLHGSNLQVECIRCDYLRPAGDILDELVEVLSGYSPDQAGGEIGDASTGRSETAARDEVADGISNLSLRMPEPDEIPLCPECGGYLKPATVMFGQNLRSGDLARAEAMLKGCDLLLAMGSTLMVQPASSIPVIARNNGARLAIVTRGETPLDNLADYRIDGPIAPPAEAAIDALSPVT